MGRLLVAGRPTLLVVARGLGNDHHIDQVLKSFPPIAATRVRRHEVEDSNHILTAGDAPTEAAAALTAWIEECGFSRS